MLCISARLSLGKTRLGICVRYVCNARRVLKFLMCVNVCPPFVNDRSVVGFVELASFGLSAAR